MEKWKDVIGYKGVYQVSDLGRVRRIAPWSDGRKTKPGFLTTHCKNRRYSRVLLHDKRRGKPQAFAVHRLVMAAFVGPIPFDHETNHKNGKKQDNRLTNLEYLTHSENQKHMYRVLNIPTARRPGSKHHAAKITEADALAIRALRKRGWMLKELAREFGLSVPTVCWICKNKAWTHI